MCQITPKRNPCTINDDGVLNGESHAGDRTGVVNDTSGRKRTTDVRDRPRPVPGRGDPAT